MTSPKTSRGRKTEVLRHKKGFTPFEIDRPKGPSGVQARAGSQTGFTLIEVLVVIAIFLILAALSLGIGVDTVGRATAGSERTAMVQLLERARSRAMNNIGNVPHGVVVMPTDFVLFAGASYSSTDPSNEVSSRSAGITVTGMTSIVFTQLSGTTTPATIEFSNGAQTYTVGINSEGRIDR